MNSQIFYLHHQEIIDKYNYLQKQEKTKPILDKCKSFVGKCYKDLNFRYFKVLEVSTNNRDNYGLKCITIYESQLDLDCFESLNEARHWIEIEEEVFNEKLNKFKQKLNHETTN